MIEFERVSVSYDGGATLVVRDLSLKIAKGELVALAGASGCGKTSLLKTVNRLHDPMSGEVRVNSAPAIATAAETLRRSIGYVFQGIGLFPHFTVAENIAITPKLLGWSAADRAARVEELLDLVELPRGFASRLPRELSGGQQQRVGVARALAAGPKILLMDEPFAALDPLTRDALGAKCRSLHDDLGLTTIMVTHDMQEAILLADRIVVMDRGTIVADGMPAQLMKGGLAPGPAALLDLPRRQAERVRARLEGSA